MRLDMSGLAYYVDTVDSFVSNHLFEVSYGWNPFKHSIIKIPRCLFLSWDISIAYLKVSFVTMEVEWFNIAAIYIGAGHILRFCIWVKYESHKLVSLGWLILIEWCKISDQKVFFQQHLYRFCCSPAIYSMILYFWELSKRVNRKLFLHLGLQKPNANSGHEFFNWFGLIENPLKC